MPARSLNRAAWITLASVVAITCAFAVCTWHRRWMSDDGLIDVRIARQIDAGNGPVFNTLDRAEANTSVLWPWLLAGVGATGADLVLAAVVLGGVLSVLGLLIAVDATRRWYRARGCDAPLLPGSAFIVLGMFPFWDFATSGLETGLTTLWIGTSWWLLVGLRAPEAISRRRELVTAFLIGLAPLVRPDLALVAAVFLVTAWRIVRPSRRRTVLLAAASAGLPLGYEIFRAGYYGTLVPLPALAKGAATAKWSHGLKYLVHFVVPSALWLPLGVLAVLLARALIRRQLTGVDRMLLAAPIASGLLLALYVVRVGGDFMHARMLLAPTLLVVLPALLLPFGRAAAPAILLLLGWSLFEMLTVHTYDPGRFDWYSDWDERVSYVDFTGMEHPVHAEDFVNQHGAAKLYREMADANAPPLVVWDHNGAFVPMDPDVVGPVVMVSGMLGTGGLAIPLDGTADDILGLANPVGARIPPTFPGRIGHEKQLPWAWILADVADPRWVGTQQFDPATTPAMVYAARRALRCGELAELLASVRDPLTPSRFWKNLVGSWRRTRLEIPSDPFAAERRFCSDGAVAR